VVNPRARADFGARSVVLTGRARAYAVEGFPGPLSLKGVLRGAAHWRTQAGRFTVHPDTLLLLDAGCAYDLHIDSPLEEVHTFCVFFRDGLVEEAARTLRLPDAALLDAPAPAHPARASAGLFERLYTREGALGEALARLQRAVARGVEDADALGVDGLVHRLARLTAGLDGEVARERARLPALRASTRAELHRRLLRAREALEGELARPWTLAALARVAAMAPHHFHRSFRAAFGEPPHRLLLRRRMERARALLLTTARPVGEVCADVGFRSPGSFGKAFLAHFGQPPSALRRAGLAGADARETG
jgi:AraC-like DNA-binding protein